MQLDPQDERRLGFRLKSGWAGQQLVARTWHVSVLSVHCLNSWWSDEQLAACLWDLFRHCPVLLLPIDCWSAGEQTAAHIWRSCGEMGLLYANLPEAQYTTKRYSPGRRRMAVVTCAYQAASSHLCVAMLLPMN